MSSHIKVRAVATLVLGSAIAIGACDNATDPLENATNTITITSGNTQSDTVGATLAAPLVVTVKDKDGKPIVGTVVTFTQDNGGTLGTVEATTDASGEATSTFTLGTAAGAETVTATVAGAQVGTVFTETAKPGHASQLVAVGGDGQAATAGSTLTAALVVKAEDRFGNPVDSVTITWSASAGSVTDGATDVSDADGDAAATVQLPGTSGTVLVTATLDGNPNAKVIFTEIAN